LNGFLISSVFFVDVNLKGGTADEPQGTQEGAQIIVGDACMEGSQDWVVRPIGAVVAGISLARS
jgi:hypothetical protein